MLDGSDRGLFEAPFLLDDIKSVVWEGAGDKSSGPYGFNLGFSKACWDIVKGGLMRAVEEFHRYTRVPKAVIASFITLISKVGNHFSLNEFRHICLVVEYV